MSLATLQHVVSSIDYTDIQIAKALNVNRTTAFRWRKVGMPTTDLEAAKAWAQNRKPAAKKLESETIEDIAPIPVNGETAYDVRDRLQTQEQAISAEIKGLSAALEEARSNNVEKKAYQLLQALKSAREEHRRQADSLLKAEGRIILLEKSRGSLVNLDVAKDFISKCIVPLTIYLRKLPDSSRNSDERALLVTLGEAGLEIIKSSARAAIEFNGKE